MKLISLQVRSGFPNYESGGVSRSKDGTYGSVDRDIQWVVWRMNPESASQAAAMEKTLMERRYGRDWRAKKKHGTLAQR